MAAARRRPTGGDRRRRAADAARPDGDARHVPDRGLDGATRRWPSWTARIFAIARTIPASTRSGSASASSRPSEEIERVADDRRAARGPHARRRLPPAAAPDDPRPGRRDDATCADRRDRSPRSAASWAEIRWRQFRNAPRPVVRAVLSSLVVAIVLGLGYLAYDVALRRGAVAARRRPADPVPRPSTSRSSSSSGSVVTWLVVPQPRGSGDVDDALGVERGARLLRGRARLLPRPGRRRPGAGAADRLTAAATLCAPGTTSVHGAAMVWPIRTIPRYSRADIIRSVGYPARQARTHSWRWTSSTSRCRSCTAPPPTRGRPAPAVLTPRPFDPDDLPIEAVQTEEERELAASLPAHTYAAGWLRAIGKVDHGERRRRAPAASAEPEGAGRPDPRPGDN